MNLVNLDELQYSIPTPLFVIQSNRCFLELRVSIHHSTMWGDY